LFRPVLNNIHFKNRGVIMGIVSTMNVGVVAGAVAAVSLGGAFLAYMTIFGRKSSTRQKDAANKAESKH
jgi:hypothetical protein